MDILFWKGRACADLVGDTRALLRSLYIDGVLLPERCCTHWRPVRGQPDWRWVEIWG